MNQMKHHICFHGDQLPIKNEPDYLLFCFINWTCAGGQWRHKALEQMDQ